MGSVCANTHYSSDEEDEAEKQAIINSSHQTNIGTENSHQKYSVSFDEHKKRCSMPDLIDVDRSEAELLLRAKILTAKDALEVPKKFGKWFPKKHAHKKCSKLWKIRREIGKGVTGIIYSIKYRDHEYALKKIEVQSKNIPKYFIVRICNRNVFAQKITNIYLERQ